MDRSLLTFLLAGVIGVFGLSLAACDPAEDPATPEDTNGEVEQEDDDAEGDDY